MNGEVVTSTISGTLPGLLTWEAGVVIDKPLLEPELAEKLRPLMVTLGCAKFLPIHESAYEKAHSNKFEEERPVPVFAKAYADTDVDQDDRRRAFMEEEKEKLENSLRTQTREKDNRSRASDSPPAASPAEGTMDSASSVINALGSFMTHFEPHGNEVRWDAKHVVFLGDADPHVP